MFNLVFFDLQFEGFLPSFAGGFRVKIEDLNVLGPAGIGYHLLTQNGSSRGVAGGKNTLIFFYQNVYKKWLPHLSKNMSVLKQNVTQLPAPFYGNVF